MRDSQRGKVYKAEEKFYKSSSRIETVWGIENYIELVCSNTRLRVEFGKELAQKIGVTDGRSRTRAVANRYRIAMPVWSRYEGVILHELAHVINIRKNYGFGKEIAGHGWEFCDIYLKLVHAMMGKEAYLMLRDAFREHKVRYKPKQTRIMSPDAIQALRNRMEMVRSARAI